MIPMRIHAISTPAGPPALSAEPEPTNRPVPIEPPERMRRCFSHRCDVMGAANSGESGR